MRTKEKNRRDELQGGWNVSWASTRRRYILLHTCVAGCVTVQRLLGASIAAEKTFVTPHSTAYADFGRLRGGDDTTVASGEWRVASHKNRAFPAGAGVGDHFSNAPVRRCVADSPRTRRCCPGSRRAPNACLVRPTDQT